MTTRSADRPNRQRPHPRELLDELLRNKSVQPIRSVEDLAGGGIFDTDEDMDEFIAFTHAQRRADAC